MKRAGRTTRALKGLFMFMGRVIRRIGARMAKVAIPTPVITSPTGRRNMASNTTGTLSISDRPISLENVAANAGVPAPRSSAPVMSAAVNRRNRGIMGSPSRVVDPVFIGGCASRLKPPRARAEANPGELEQKP